MPCPSQMVEDKEEGSQVNSERPRLPAPALLELLPAVANGKQSKRMSSRWPAVRGALPNRLLGAT